MALSKQEQSGSSGALIIFLLADMQEYVPLPLAGHKVFQPFGILIRFLHSRIKFRGSLIYFII